MKSISFVGIILYVFSSFSGFAVPVILYPNEITATSYLYEDAANWFPPIKLYDQNDTTSYSEALRGDGIGNQITFTYQSKVKISEVRIVNGFQEKIPYYLQNNRVKKIQVQFFMDAAVRETVILDIQDIPEPQTFRFIAAIECNRVVVEFAEVYKGSKFDDTCLAEVTYFGETADSRICGKENLDTSGYTSALAIYKGLDNISYVKMGGCYVAGMSFKGNDVSVSYSFDIQGPFCYSYHYRYSITGNTINFYPRKTVREIDKPGFDNIYGLSKEQLNDPKHWPPVACSTNPLELIAAKILQIDNKFITLKFERVDGSFIEMFKLICEFISPGTTFTNSYIFSQNWEFKNWY